VGRASTRLALLVVRLPLDADPTRPREVLTSGIESHRREDAADRRLEQVREAGDRRSRSPGECPTARARAVLQLLELQDGKIIGMHDYADPARALCALRA
jgi:hypothetical protein